MATEHTTTTAAKLIPEIWSQNLLEETTEEMVVATNFAKPEGVSKINGKLHIRKVLRIAATGANASGLGLNYTANTEQEVTATPIWAYAAVEINHAVYTRMDVNPDNTYRDMLKYGLAEYIDQYCAQQAASLVTNVKGSGLADMDLGLFLDAQMALAISSKRRFKVGITPWYIKLHPTQLKNTMSIFNLIADYVRGDGVKPVVSGWLSPVLGANVDETGNVYQAGGVTHNPAFLEDAFVLAYNEEPTVLDPQPFELVKRVIATTEFGTAIQYDNFAVDIQSKAA